ncbi:MAG: sigma-70 family RNA polymerase sigma factor [Candidatus Latescibacteria bacterium]|nr:sigma-70 family RNA polymerase sigma factor [Candidatus Latescibacterota bacterium]
MCLDELAEAFSRAQQGDKVAFGKLVRRYQDLAVGYAYAVLGDFHHAEDATQDAFVDAFNHIDQVYELRSFPAWLKKVVFKHCDRITRRQTLPTAPADTADHVPADQPDPHEHMERENRKDMVWDMLSKLPDNDRQVITLYYMSGYPQKEIAAFLDISAPAVRRRLHTARKRLKERLLTMAEDTLQNQAPSKDDAFVGKVAGKISGCITTGLTFADAAMLDTVFDNVNMQQAKYHNINLSKSHFEDINLSGSNFTKIDFSNVDLVDCQVQGMTINGILVSTLLEKYGEAAS